MKKTYTSAEAAKLLRLLNEEYDALLTREQKSYSFLAATGEDVESVRPDYNFARVQDEAAELEGKIRRLKHAINIFNTTTEVPGFGMTIDAMLIYIPQLTRRCNKLAIMKSVLPKERDSESFGRSSPIIDYRYANYDVEEAARRYTEAAEELARAQTALDVVNNTITFEFDLG